MAPAFVNSLVLAASNSIVEIEEGGEESSIGKKFTYFEDKSGDLGLEQVLIEEKNGNFQSPSPDFYGVYSDSVFWVKIQIKNHSSSSIWFLYQTRVIWQVFEAYIENPYLKNFKKVDISHARVPIVQLDLANHGSITTIYLRVKDLQQTYFRLGLQTTQKINRWMELYTLFLGFAFGGILALIIYNGFLFFSVRKDIYLFYVIFGVVNLIFAFISVNFPFNIMSVIDQIWIDVIYSARPLSPLLSFPLAIHLLHTKENFPKIHKSFVGFILFFLALILVFLLDPSNRTLYKSIQDLTFVISAVYTIWACSYALYKGYMPALYFLLGLVSFLGAMIIYLLSNSGIIGQSAFTEVIHLLGQTLEMLLMSLAVGARIKILEAEKIVAEIKAEETDRLRHLIRVLFHDIANPLSIIKSYATILISKEEGNKVFNAIKRSSLIIEDIIKYVRKSEAFNTGSVCTDISSVELKDAFEAVFFLFENKAKEKGVFFHIRLEPENLKVKAERISLVNEVLGNLVSNAIKFSFSGKRVLLEAVEKGDKVLIRVVDRGIGINDKILKNIFLPFAHTSRPGTSGEQGTGFGMPILSKYVTEYDGEINIKSKSIDDSTTDHGTVVEITLQKCVD